MSASIPFNIDVLHAAPPINEQQKENRFKSLKPPMHTQEAHTEASRCLFCYDAPCTTACPTDIDVPLFIRQILTHNTTQAAHTILSKNIFGQSCAHVCPTEVLCEGACVYQQLNQKPIAIGRLQAFATQPEVVKKMAPWKPLPRKQEKIAILGAGPAGLSCAHQLTQLGYIADVFESKPHAGGLNRYGIAPYKWNNACNDQEIAFIQQIGFSIFYKHHVVATQTNKTNPNPSYVEISLQELESQYHAIFLGLGLKSKPSLFVSEHTQGIYSAEDFLAHMRAQEGNVIMGQKAVVIGGGNTAIDAAIACQKLGAKTTLVYRRTRQEQSAYAFEIEHALKLGVSFLYELSPQRVLTDHKQNDSLQARTWVRAVVFEHTQTNEQVTQDADLVLLAIGQQIPEIITSINGLTTQHGRVLVNAQLQTTNPRYFAGGDLINGGKEVVNAVADGRQAALGIHHYLRSQIK